MYEELNNNNMYGQYGQSNNNMYGKPNNNNMYGQFGQSNNNMFGQQQNQPNMYQHRFTKTWKKNYEDLKNQIKLKDNQIKLLVSQKRTNCR